MFSTEKIYQRNPLTSWQKLDQQVLIISEDNQYAHELNEIAAFVWERLDTKNISDIASELIENYEVENSTLLTDLRDLVIDLQNKKLVL
jgi:alkyl hydroperoxide reductase subunit AhpC